MNAFRSHIFSRTIALLLCCGFMLCMVQPVHAEDRSDKFADWLSSVLHEAEDLQLREELSQLKDARLDFHQLVGHASEIVSRHNSDFDLPIGEAPASDRIYQVLLTEWDQFQTGNTMSSVPAPGTVKLQLQVQTNSLSAGFPQTTPDGNPHAIPRTGTLLTRYAHAVPVPALMPMVDAIAIGAP